ncbi:MAG: hypothetical protein EBZ50_12350 [Alphaproteobacteria bacterium]|nr:hypothetical protein [Alphaproteobacteria bacterium]
MAAAERRAQRADCRASRAALYGDAVVVAAQPTKQSTIKSETVTITRWDMVSGSEGFARQASNSRAT